jgi:hypothetical protein
MLEAVPLLAVTTFFISIFIYAYANLQLEEIRANWNERRCETLVMLLADMVPDGKDPNVDPTKFATDNLFFCMNKLVDKSMTASLDPVTGAINAQIDLANPIAASMNYLRSNAKSLLDPLNKMVQSLWDSAKVIAIKISTTFYLIASAFQRTQALVLSTVFAGFAIFKGILNLLALVRRIVAEMMAMLMMLIIFLLILSIFLPFLGGFVPFILGILVSIAASVAQAAYDELADVNAAIGFQDMPKSPGLREGLPPGR